MTDLATPLSTSDPVALPDHARRRQPIPVRDVVIHDEFWSRKQRIVRESTIPGQERMLRAKGYIEALTLTWHEGDWYTPHVFWESDLAKWIEAASYAQSTHPSPDLAEALGEVTSLLEHAQQDDGYLNTYYTLVEPGRRFTDHQDAHELYCAGHLIEAGVAHAEATGDSRLLDLVSRYADLIDRQFGAGGPDEGGHDGHPEIELALVRLYRATGERRYLDLAARLLDNRGREPFFFELERAERGVDGMFEMVFPGRSARPEMYRSYQQSHQPVRDQREAVGHSVRAVYLYTGMTDVALETGDQAMWEAGLALWRDVTERKMYVTGSIGSMPRIEGFGAAYDLPNVGGYGETCAAIGLANWTERLGNATGDARYFDLLELILYNGALGGASADGTRYFYRNPLSSAGDEHRDEWYATACCPPNIARFISALGRLIYAGNDDTLAVNLFVASSATTRIAGGDVTIAQETEYPRTGGTRITIAVDAPTEFELAVRIPGWSERVTVDGVLLAELPADGFVRLRRTWTGATTIAIDAHLPVARLHAHPAVAQCRGLVALQRGPLVFCVEEVDLGAPTGNLVLPPSSPIEVEDDPVSGLVRLTAPALVEEAGADSALYSDRPPRLRATTLTAIPYFAWDNRAPGSMDVWLREEGAALD